MCLSYKLRLMSSKRICRQIKKKSEDINKRLEKIREISKTANFFIKELKKKKIAFGKLEVQTVKPKKETKEFKNQYKDEINKIIDINHEILENYSKTINLVLDAVSNLNNLAFDIDSLIYREDKRLTLLIEKLMKTGKNHKIILKLNLLKGSMKTTALRLLEASKFEQNKLLNYPSSKIKSVEFGEKIKQLSSKVWNIEKTVEKEGIKNIEKLIRESKQEMEYLKKLTINILLVFPLAEKRLLDIENDLPLLEEKFAGKLRNKNDSAKEKLQNIKTLISERAQNLFEEIDIIAESK